MVPERGSEGEETGAGCFGFTKRPTRYRSPNGSKKAFAKGPRKIDLDILLYGNETIDTPELQVPHPRMLERKFVLIPLAEISSNLRHPSWKVGRCAPSRRQCRPQRRQKFHDAPSF